MPRANQVEVGRPNDERQVREFVTLAARALGFDDVDLDTWAQREGEETMRVARLGDEVVGGLTIQRMGQWFGGKSVPMGAVRAVGVAPERRGTGIASQLLRAALHEMLEGGVPLSTLYPATQTVYRKSGYAPAGVRTRYRTEAGAIDTGERNGDVRPLLPEDVEALSSVYAERARHDAGWLDRNDWYWQRILDPPPWLPKTTGYVVEGDGGVEGYVFCGKQGQDPKTHLFHLGLSDFLAATPQAGRRLLSFLAGYRSVVKEIAWHGAPVEPAALLLPEEVCQVAGRIDWMLRLVDVAAALCARGYAPNVSGSVHLDVSDDVMEQNHGRCVLEVANGNAAVEKGGRGDVKLDVRALASLYTGHVTPQTLRLVGQIEGDETALAALGAIFAGPPPWMPDMF